MLAKQKANKDFKNRVRELRLKKDLTQEELANKAHLTRPYLSDIERNIYQPGTLTAIRLADILGVTVKQLFFDESVQHTEQQ
jgi:transcriptional regulator with XRE-family HTH domain